MTESGEGRVTGRQSNFECLRILSMLMIIMHHIAVHGGLVLSDTTPVLNRAWVKWMQLGGKVGVDVFVLISGYFLISAHPVRLQKILERLVQVLTYSLLTYAVLVGGGLMPFETESLRIHLFPITFSLWWFASTYFVLYLLSPFLNRALSSLTKPQYRGLLLLFLILWCIIPTWTESDFQSNHLLWFVFVYAAAGYIRRFQVLHEVTAAAWLLLSLGLSLVTSALALAFDLLGVHTAFADNLCSMNALPVFLIALTLFLGFCKLRIKTNRFINTAASAAFGVYLLHDEHTLRQFVWKTIFQTDRYTDSPFLLPYSLLVTAVIFIVCTMIELLRIHVLEKRYRNVLGKLSDFMQQRLLHKFTD